MTAQTQPAQPEALRLATLFDTECATLFDTYAAAKLLRRLHAENEQLRSAMNIPTIEKGSQDWLSSDPAIAWHLIDRHADNWADIGLMMQEYVDAQKLSAVQRLEARIAYLEANGPQVERGERADGGPWFGTMRQAWEDAKRAAEVEAKEVDRLREHIRLQSIVIKQHEEATEQLCEQLAGVGVTCNQLEAELVREAQRTANEKLRADQMTEQHRMQAAMNSEARAELAQLRESRKPLPVDFKGTEGINARLHYRRGWNAAQAAHGIGEKTP